MLTSLFRDLAAKHGLTTAAGMAYGMLNGCFVTLSCDAGTQRISIYVGPQEQPAPGHSESVIVSCARQIIHTISSASGPDNVYSLMTGSETIPALVLNHAGSVVTVNFSDAPEARTGIERFIAELLPQAAPLTRPLTCLTCGGACSGSACPVRLSADTVVPMHVPCCQNAAGHSAPAKAGSGIRKGAVLAALLGALVGAVVWAFLSGYGAIAWIVGVLMGLLPTLAYDLALMRLSPECRPTAKSRIVTILCCAAVAVVLGSLGGCLLALRSDYTRNISIMTYQNIGFGAFVRASLTNNSAILGNLLKSFFAGLAFAALGSIGCFLKKGDASSATAAASKPRRLKGKF